jgi:GNAT superfamily N-acetyltransferase
VFVAEVADCGMDAETEVIGGVRLEVTEPARVKLSRLAVHDDWKGEGVGSALVDHAETAAREWGHEVVWLTTPPAHPFLPDFYRDRGYERTGDYPLEYRDYDEAVYERRVVDD